MRRLIAIVVVGAFSATSMPATAAETCAVMRARKLKRCCCPPAPRGQARLICCTISHTAALKAMPRERPQQHGHVAPALTPGPAVDPAPALARPFAWVRPLDALSTGPPLLTLRI